ncbi:hypothetical protein F2Q69_00019374 [Brassica cretica]|uniref:Transposase MuDR plant domain-containing protein n=1 Tax=Brassica cretica TaxID=69181 RepID=A0A8S9QBV4_BRACR|nr:hypothetical protein F2Q69_00019374 [Brassica cretica]
MMTEDKADAVALVTGDTINSHKDLEKYSGSGVLKPCISSLWLDDHDLRVGLCFKDVDELKKAVDWYSINRQKECVVQETGEDEYLSWIMPDLSWIMSQNDRDFSLLVRLAHTARTGDRTDGLIDPFDQFMHFDQPNLTKARILHLSEDIGRTWSSLAHDPDMVAYTDSPTSVILLTAVHASGYNEPGQKPISHI